MFYILIPFINTRKAELWISAFFEKLAATYSRRTYRTTTIGKTVFDGRVRNGIGSDHSFITTKNRSSKRPTISHQAEPDESTIQRANAGMSAFSENCTQEKQGILPFAS